jgi:hypothetical protein
MTIKVKRRDFLNLLGLGGAGLMIGAGHGEGRSEGPGGSGPSPPPTGPRFDMHGYAAPKLETVRVAVSGVGERGSGSVARLAAIEGVEIRALNDVVRERVEQVTASLRATPHRPGGYWGGEDAWKEICQRDDIDLFVIATPWRLHAPQAVYAMEHGKHVYVELPAAQTIEECWQLVETSERTRRHCFQVSSDCHGGIAAVLLNMVRKGFFGELIHGEGAYIHDRVSDDDRWTRDELGWFGFRPWRLDENIGRHGNLYPQHGLGPVAQMMDLNYGDQMDYLVSMSGADFTMSRRMQELAERDASWAPYVGRDYRGNMNTSIIRTKRGRTIMLQHDISSPRPDVRFSLISGTKGTYQAGPPRISTGHHGWLSGPAFDALVEEYTPEITRRFDEMVRRAGARPAGRSYARTDARDWRLIDCLRNGLPLENDVYDAALWTAVIPLSEHSVGRRSAPVDVPDFTRGAWETNERGMDVNLERGGGNTGLVRWG